MLCEEASRKSWAVRGVVATEGEINMGSLQRIAAACEAMAGNWSALTRELDRFKAALEAERRVREHLERRVRGLRGALTRMRRQREER